MVAAVSCGPKGQLALLVDEASQQRFLVDTGSSYSILPHKFQQPQSGPRAQLTALQFLAGVAAKCTWQRVAKDFPGHFSQLMWLCPSLVSTF